MNLKMTHTIQLFHQQEASLIYVLSLHRKHLEDQFRGRTCCCKCMVCSTIWIRKTNIADVNSLLCYFDFGTFAGILYLKTGFQKWVCLKVNLIEQIDEILTK